MEASFATSFTAGVVDEFSVEPNEDVGDELLMAWVIFGCSAIHEEVVLRVKDGGQVFIDVCIDALEGAEGV